MSDSIWVTVKEVAQVRNCSERYVLKLIAQNAIKARKAGRRWLVLLEGSELVRDGSDNGSASTIQTTQTTTNIRATSGSDSSELVRVINQQLEDKNNEIKYLKDQLEQKDRHIEAIQKSADESSERSDTIIISQTRQLVELQNMLESHKQSWWKRLRLNKGENEKH